MFEAIDATIPSINVDLSSRQEQRYINSMFVPIRVAPMTELCSRKLITKVRNVLEAQSPRPQQRFSSAPPSAVPTETITIRTDVRKFESFLRSINRCSSLLDARRLKNDVMGEIRRTRMLLGEATGHIA